MLRALYSAASGLFSQQTQLDVTSNNIANVGTTGFKKTRLNFQDLMYQTLSAPPAADKPAGGAPPDGLQIGTGVKVSGTQKIFTVGSLTQTNNNLDLAVTGDGFLQVKGADGAVMYTRDGSLQLDGRGRIVTGGGLLLDPPITLPPNTGELVIAADGKISAVKAGGGPPQDLGQITLARFMNPAGLRAIGGNLFAATDAAGKPVVSAPGADGMGQLRQGYLEGSNVSVVEEMVQLIMAQRAFEINSRSVRAADEMLSQANNLTR